MPTNSGEASTPANPETSTLAQIVAAADYTERIAAVAERIAEARDQATVHALLMQGVHALGAEIDRHRAQLVRTRPGHALCLGTAGVRNVVDKMDLAY